jgi:hypothetical protein
MKAANTTLTLMAQLVGSVLLACAVLLLVAQACC